MQGNEEEEDSRELDELIAITRGYSEADDSTDTNCGYVDSNGVYQPTPEELDDLIEVVRRSEARGEYERFSQAQVEAILARQIKVYAQLDQMTREALLQNAYVPEWAKPTPEIIAELIRRDALVESGEMEEIEDEEAEKHIMAYIDSLYPDTAISPDNSGEASELA